MNRLEPSIELNEMAVSRSVGTLVLAALAVAAEAYPSFAALDSLIGSDSFAPWAGRKANFRVTQEVAAMQGFNGSYGLSVSVIRE